MCCDFYLKSYVLWYFVHVVSSSVKKIVSIVTVSVVRLVVLVPEVLFF